MWQATDVDLPRLELVVAVPLHLRARLLRLVVLFPALGGVLGRGGLPPGPVEGEKGREGGLPQCGPQDGDVAGVGDRRR